MNEFFLGFFACNHHRAPYYFAESINTHTGFWGWSCDDYFQYLLGRCPPHDPQMLMGEDVDKKAEGMHLVITDSVPPFAVGKFTGPTIDIYLRNYHIDKNKTNDWDKKNTAVNDIYMDYFDYHSFEDMLSSNFGDFNETYFSDYDVLLL